jgi:hypothetical protein
MRFYGILTTGALGAENRKPRKGQMRSMRLYEKG